MAGLGTFAFAASILGTVLAFSPANAAQMAPISADLTPQAVSDNLVLVGSKSVTVSKSSSKSSSIEKLLQRQLQHG